MWTGMHGPAPFKAFKTLAAWIWGIVRDLAACEAGYTNGQGRR
jgi:hypothetical protein